MSDSRWQRIKDLFADAIALEPGEREALLARECATDPELRREVESLLRAHRPSLGAEWGAETLSERPGTHVGPYKLLEEIGEGGFGVVFLAEQESPVRRRVALKVVKPGMDTRQVVARFEQERQALAMMEHPSIARVFDAGTTASGRPYFVMELVRGDPITTYCDREKLTTAERLRLFAEVCRAVQHAHQKGVIHRDLKPGNVLVTIVDGKPVPKVIDFGVAKATQGRLTDKTLFTAHRQIIGTPLYMSPEQAQLSGVDVDTRSDVYSLGVLLYELLVGVPPFGQEQLMQAGYAEMYRMIRELEPQKPSTRVATLGPSSTTVAAQRGVEARRLGVLLRGDLDWIVMRCLEKERARRYDTASDLAQDLERHLAGEPVEAAPPSAVYRVRKLVRRRRTAFSAGAAVVIVALAGIATTLRTESKRTAEAVAAGIKQRALAEAATRSATEAAEARGLAEKETRKAQENAYVSAVLGAAAAQRVDGTPAARRLLDQAPKELRSWEWDYLYAQSDTSLLTLSGQVGVWMDSSKFSSDGTRVLTVSHDMEACAWDANSGRQMARFEARVHANNVLFAVAFSDDGMRIVTVPDDTKSILPADNVARVWDAKSSNAIATLKGANGRGRASFSPDGTRILVTSYDMPAKGARVWDAMSGDELYALGRGTGVTSAAFSPDGTRIVTASSDGPVRVWDADAGNELVMMEDSVGCYSIAFSADGIRVITAHGTGALSFRVWDVRSGKQLMSLDSGNTVGSTLAVSPDGSRIVTGDYDDAVDDWAAYVWDASTHEQVVRLEGPAGMYSARFSPDGKRIVMSSKGDDATPHIWDAISGRVLARLDGHGDLVDSVEFSPDGSRIVTASWDGTARVWDATPSSNEFALSEESAGQYYSPVAFSPDGTRLILVSRNDTVSVLDSLSGDDLVRLQLEAHTGSFRSAVFSPDGTRIVTASDDDMVRVWDAYTGQELMTAVVSRTGQSRSVEWWGLWSAAYGPDGASIVTASRDAVRVLDAKSGVEIRRMEGNGCNVAVFSPDQTRIVMAEGSGLVDVWDAKSGNAVLHLKAGTGGPGEEETAAFSPDGTRIVTTCSGEPARVWDATTGDERLVLEAGRPIEISGAVFSPDGKRIAAAASGDTARIWDATSGKELIRLQHRAYVVSIAFSADGTRIATASRDGVAHMWDCIPYRVRHAEQVERDAGLSKAEAAVTRLLGETGDWTNAADKLRTDPTLTKPVRCAALNMMSRRANRAYIACRNVEAMLAEAKWMSRILGQETWPSEREVNAEISSEVGLETEAWALNRLAWQCVGPDAVPSGSEVRACILAGRAVATAVAADSMAQDVAKYRCTLAYAQFRLGRFDEALGEQGRALAEAPHALKAEYQELLNRLESGITTLRDGSGNLREAEITLRVEALQREAATLAQDPDVRLWLGKVR